MTTITIAGSRIPKALLKENFVCSVSACKGQCCKDGNTGAPLLAEEIPVIEAMLESILEHLDDVAVEQIRAHGWRESFTRTLADGPSMHPDGNQFQGVSIRDDKVCVFGVVDDDGVASCAVEMSYEQTGNGLKKPLVCHLYPLRISREVQDCVDEWELRPRNACQAACDNGDALGVSVVHFLREAIVRAKGEDFYEQLERAAIEVRGKASTSSELVQIARPNRNSESTD